jgi:transcriptional regulator GlxA family with amidase domain
VTLGELREAQSLGETRRAHRAAIEALRVFRASGVPFGSDAEDHVANDVAPEAHAFAQALESTANRLGDQPMAVDLARALGVGQRQALRRAHDHFRAFHLTVTTWREYMLGVRLAMGAFFSAAPGARTDAVSRLVGFGSPVSFCHALHAAGLPSPQELQRRHRAVVGTAA